jgi:hypothetical protein
VSFDLPPADPSPAFLNTARPLNLSMVPATPAAVALVDAVLAMVVVREAEGRTRQRGAKQQEALKQGVGAFVGGLLWQWAATPPRPSARGAMAADFTGGPVSYRTYVAVRDALKELGLIAEVDGQRFSIGEGFLGTTWRGWVARYWPLPPLLALAETRGLAPENARSAFRVVAAVRAPVIVRPVVAEHLKTRDGGRMIEGATIVLPADFGPFARAAAEVDAQNVFAATIEVTGCTPPRWVRRFGPDPRLHGRWYAQAASKADGAVYQPMKKVDRVSFIRIGGEEVAEMDVSASLLSILHGLRGQELPAGDPYAVEEFPRSVVKAWITTTIGKGRGTTRWGREADIATKVHKAAEVRAAVLARYPFLADLVWCLPADLRDVSPGPGAVVPHFLMGLEASALTVAMSTLRDQGVLALPMHDGLIVPRTAQEAARKALEAGYAAVAGVVAKVVESR